MSVQDTIIDPQALDTQTDPIPKCFDLYGGRREYYLELGVPLYRAAVEGDWKTAKEILEKHPNLATAWIGARADGQVNVLHIACMANCSDHFIKELVLKCMSKEDLALTTSLGDTPLGLLAQCQGNVELAKLMVQKNETLPLMRDANGDTPLALAADSGHGEMARYLLSVTDLQQLTLDKRFGLLCRSINSELYDVALEVFNKCPDLALHKEANGDHALLLLARKQLKSHSTQGSSWTDWISHRYLTSWRTVYPRRDKDEALVLVDKLWKKVFKDGTDEQLSEFLAANFEAAEVGNIEFIAKTVGAWPDQIRRVDGRAREWSIFGIAVSKRHVDVFNLIYEIQGMKAVLAPSGIDQAGNCILHLAAMPPPTESLHAVSGAALQLQRELLWYKAVEKLTPVGLRNSQNKVGNIPRSLFTKSHTTLRREGEEWMKTTSGSCFVVATLVATIAFAAAFTIPGGNDQTTGIPIFQHYPTFLGFAIADAISLFSSTTAMLIFLGILTSRYAEDDFLEYLPLRLLIGLSMLFFSIASMMVAFASTFFIIFKAGLPLISVPIIVAILASIPVGVFAIGQFPLLIDIYRSTYEARYLFRNKRRIFKVKKNSEHDHLLKRFALKCLRKGHYFVQFCTSPCRKLGLKNKLEK